MGLRSRLIWAFEARLKGRRTFEHWARLETSQWLSSQEIATAQLEALRNLVRHADATCRYYRDEWSARGLLAEQLDSLEAFQRWPILERETVRTEASGLKSNDRKLKRISKATGGSSGVPLQFDLDSGSYERRMAATFRGYAWAGAAPGTRQLYLWGTSPTRQASVARAKTLLYDRLYNRKILSAFELSDEATPGFLRELTAWRPQVIVGYTNALYAFARSLNERGLVPPAPRSIVVGAEKLHSFQREFLEAVFRAPVFETYGSREFMLMAAQCERRSALHVTAENLIVEVVDDAGRGVAPGIEGRVVVTDLYNFAMPFIRYANGDRAVAGGACDCGRGLPTLAEVVGRQADMLLTPDGRRLPGLYFPHLLKDFAAVKQFQVSQDRLDEVVLKLVAPTASAADLDRITNAAQSALGPLVRFSIERVGEIPLTAAGKLLVVVSRVGERGHTS